MLRFLFLLEKAVQVLLGGHEFGVERGQVGEDIFFWIPSRRVAGR